MTRVISLGPALTLLWVSAAAGQWAGFVDESDALATDTFLFKGTNGDPDYPFGNENYYDGDFADFNGDRLPDRALGARYGLLMNTGGGLMTPFAGRTGFTFRGMPGATGWGEDAFNWADIDGDGDYDVISGGNNEPLAFQINERGRFSIKTTLGRSALNIVNTDVEGDGDVDLVLGFAFCATGCGGSQFSLLVNDGNGNYTEESVARGVGYDDPTHVVGIASGDMNGDGHLDLVIEHGAAQTVDVALNDGSGNFTIVPNDLPTACSGFGQSLNLGDIDDDGDLDVVVVGCTGDGTGSSGHPLIDHAIGINDGAGNLENQSASRFDDGGYAMALRAGNGKLFDVDYDGDLDLVALRTHNDVEWPTGFNQVQVFTNDGAGNFTYSTAHSLEIPSDGNALGAGTDIADLDGDGTYDLWVGVGGGRVRILMNPHADPTGLPADLPRDVDARVSGSDVVLSWRAPPFASAARYYKVYRATSPGLDDADRRLIKIVGRPNQDEALLDPITRHTTTAYLGDPDVTLDGATGTLRFTDTTALPGQRYYYTVSHVGGENQESRQSAELVVEVPAVGGADGEPPVIDILSPTSQDWSAYPRVVLHLADGGSGVDVDSLRISFDRDLGDPGNGGRAAGTDVSDLAYRTDAGAVVLALEPPLALPSGMIATMTAAVSDLDGNAANEQVPFFVAVSSASEPTASFSASATSGPAPLEVAFDASGSTDADGKLFSWEWYFGDGTTALGRTVTHTFGGSGSYGVTLLVRDNEGGVSVTSRTIDVGGDPAVCALGDTESCYGGPVGTEGVGPCSAGLRACSAGDWGACAGSTLPGVEDCGSGLDDDCDGATDADDLDCGGEGGAGPGTSADGGDPDGGGTPMSGGEGAAGDGGAPTDMGIAGSGEAGAEPPDGAGGGDDGRDDGGCACTTGVGVPRASRPAGLAGLPALALLWRRRNRRARRGVGR